MAQQRSLIIFENCIKSKATKRVYLQNLGYFKDFYKLRDFDSILTIDNKGLQVMIEDYVMYLKGKVSPNSIPTKMYPIQTFLEVNDVIINWKKIKRLFPQKVKNSGNKPWTTKDIQKMLEFAPDLRARALIHVLAASGVRIGALEEMKLTHLSRMSNDCYSLLIYPDSVEEYVTFLHPEASNALDAYLGKRRRDGENWTGQSPMIREQYQLGIQEAYSLTTRGMTNILERIVKNAHLRDEKKSQRFSTQINHGFRKRFHTILNLQKDINPNAVEKLVGHKNGVAGVYYNPTKSELFEQYQLGIQDLIIDDSARIEAEKKIIEEEKSQLESKNKELEDTLNKVNRLENDIIDLKEGYKGALRIITRHQKKLLEKYGTCDPEKIKKIRGE